MEPCPRGVYRPRNSKKTGFHRLVEEHYEEFERVYPERYKKAFGRFRPVIGKVVRKYLTCGDLRQGFARVRCPDCGHEYLLAYSCKGRYFCTSCHAKRAAVFAERLNETVLRPVPHRQIVFTVPKLLRVYFRNDRRLLGDLCRVAAGVITEGIQALLGKAHLTPGVVICVQTYGNFVNWNPHLHCIVTDGGFTPTGVLHVLPRVSLTGMEDLFRHRVLQLLMDKGKLQPERVKMLLGWRHSGFNLDASVRIGARDERGRESIARYIIRAPFSVAKLRYLPGKNTVIYKSKLVKGLNRNFGLYTPLDFLAAVTSHIPDAWEHLTRYYGWYSSVQRGKRIKAGLEEKDGEPVAVTDGSPGAKAARRNWARFIRKIYEVDPLLCPDCGGAMKIIAFIIEDRTVIRRILIHLQLWEEPEPRPPPIIKPPTPIDIEYVPCFE